MLNLIPSVNIPKNTEAPNQMPTTTIVPIGPPIAAPVRSLTAVEPIPIDA
ncbi:hypothetical protein QCI44_10380 [Bacillus cereus group sp. RP37]|nr:hypothetical protein [Bacillus wiedmannii]MDA1599389.1 hypothetical protein [Bacillus cereus]HDR6298112.1 hypothetical protein [Bacillus cereus]HDX9669740.1 hypothetical protein [Bacillus cereus]